MASTKKTVHFQGKFKGKFNAVPYCMQMALSPKFGEMTENKDEVTCTRCAAKLGITPAQPKASSTVGTCQCCFNVQETRKSNLVLHGYQRPGWGYTVGRCRGVGHLPYELSCERTKAWKTEVEAMLVIATTHLENLKCDRIPMLLAEIPDGTYDTSRGRRIARKVFVEVKLGDEQKLNPHFQNRYWEVIPSYEALRTQAVAKCQDDIAQMKSTIDFLGDKVASWTLQVWPKNA